MCNSIDRFPSRIRYYLLDWKDENMDSFNEMFPCGRGLCDLTPDEIKQLFETVTELNKFNIKER